MPTVSRTRPPSDASADVESRDVDDLPRAGSDRTSSKRPALIAGAVTIAIGLGIAAVVVLPGRDDTATPASAPTPAAATVPGTPTVSMTPPDTTGTCVATWTADRGGSPIRRYLVQSEPRSTAPTPDGVDPGVDVGAPARAIQTSETSGSFALGSSVIVAARNAIGTSPRSASVVCGG